MHIDNKQPRRYTETLRVIRKNWKPLSCPGVKGRAMASVNWRKKC